MLWSIFRLKTLSPPRTLRLRKTPLRHSSTSGPSPTTTSTPKAPPGPTRATPSPSPSSPTSNNNSTTLSRLTSRLPPRLQSSLKPLYTAPVSHITSFLILHELTAIVPLFGLAGLFHYTNYLPSSFVENESVKEGVRRFGKWLRRRGWVGEEEGREAVRLSEVSGEEKGEVGVGLERGVGVDGAVKGEMEESTGAGVRLVVEFATAYAITKALLPVRIVGCVWATPWFARVVVGPVGRVVGRVFGKGGGRGKVTEASVKGK